MHDELRDAGTDGRASGRGRAAAAGTALLASAALAGCAGSDPLLRVDAALFAPEFKGDVGLSNSIATDATTIDIASDLDLGDTDYVPYLRGECDVGPFNVAASAFKTSQEATGVVTADFGNITAGSTVESELDLFLAQGRAIVDLIDTSIVKVGLGLAAEWVDFELVEVEQTFGLTEEVDVNQVVPLIAVHAAAGIDLPYVMPLRLDLNVAGMTLDYDDIDGTVVDAEAMLRGDIENFGWFAGYRFVLVETDGEIDDQNFEGDITLAGWLVGLSVRF
jgi:hypothetical protein